VAGGIVVAGAGSIFQSEEKPNPHIPQVPDPGTYSKSDLAAAGQGIQVTLPKLELPASADEILVTADGIWAQGQFFPTDRLMRQSLFASAFEERALQSSLRFPTSMQNSDWRTFHAYFSESQETNGDLSPQIRGENALAFGNYEKAVQDLGRAIEIDPRASLPVLQRGAAHFALGEYDRSLADYQQFTSQIETPPTHSVTEFCVGFAKGLPKGTYESGEGLFLFLVDFATHPIQTSKQAFDSLATLANLVRQDEWSAVAEALSP
jgi:tetratricopeptide (TPR) repeat protein